MILWGDGTPAQPRHIFDCLAAGMVAGWESMTARSRAVRIRRLKDQSAAAHRTDAATPSNTTGARRSG